MKLRVPSIILPGRFRPVYGLSAIYLFMSFLLRLCLWKLSDSSGGMTKVDLILILGTGFFNDCVALVILFIPMVLYLAFLPDTLARTRGQRIGFAVLIFCTLCGLLILMGAEFIFFQKYNVRFNDRAVTSLVAPGDLVTTIWESYPLIWLFLTDILLAALIFMKIWPYMDQAFEHPTGCIPRMVLLAAYGLVLVPTLWIAIAGCTISNKGMVNELAHNGITSFIRSAFFAPVQTHPHEHPVTQKTGKPQKKGLPTPAESRKTSTRNSGHQVAPSMPPQENDMQPIMGKMALLIFLSKGCL
jgi:phosphoglycerol transferase MdoB-like AlkP superfamily enzyme